MARKSYRLGPPLGFYRRRILYYRIVEFFWSVLGAAFLINITLRDFFWNKANDAQAILIAHWSIFNKMEYAASTLSAMTSTRSRQRDFEWVRRSEELQRFALSYGYSVNEAAYYVIQDMKEFSKRRDEMKESERHLKSYLKTTSKEYDEILDAQEMIRSL